MIRKLIRLSVAVGILFSFSMLFADIVKLNTGGKVVGKIVEEDETKVIVEIPSGRTVILKEDIADIERGENIIAMYKKRLSEINQKKAKDHYDIAQWCKEFKLADEYEQHISKCLELDPGFAPAREELGYIYYNGKWMDTDEYYKARGWVKHEGEWMPKEKAERLEQGFVEIDGNWVSKKAFEETYRQHKNIIEKYEKAISENKEISIPEDLKQLVEMANSNDWETKAAAYEALNAKGGSASELLTNLLFKQRKEAKEIVIGYFKSSKSEIRGKLCDIVKERRRIALAIIFDRTIYPEENHGAKGQPKVDEAINRLREVYEGIFEYYLRKRENFQKKYADYEKIVGEINKYTDAKISLAEEKKKIAEETNNLIAIDKAMAPPGTESILETNKRMRSLMTEEEFNCLDTLNWYRIMLGIIPLTIDEKLLRMARSHSQCMEKNHFFSHDCPIHGSTQNRFQREDAKFTGENIACDITSGADAFRMWYRSSEHHRNMLVGRLIGIGQSGKFWTQDFS
ncbi:MAG: CAP domain-containing protein [Planctomycetota bacterium]